MPAAGGVRAAVNGLQRANDKTAACEYSPPEGQLDAPRRALDSSVHVSTRREAVHRAPRCRRLLRLDRADAAGRSCAGCRSSSPAAGPRAVVTTASYEARRTASARRCRRRGRAAVPAGRLPGARLPDLPRGLARGDGRSCAPTSSASRSSGSTRSTSTSTGLYSPKAAMRRLIAEIKRATQADVLGRDRPEQARREGRVGRGEAGRLRRAHA